MTTASDESSDGRRPSAFRFPPEATAPIAERLNLAMLRSSMRDRLRPYCFLLDTFVRGSATAGTDLPRGRVSAMPWPFRRRPRRWSGDVVVAGECGGNADLAFMTRLIDGLVRSGRTVHYLATRPIESRHLRSQARDRGWSPQFSVRDLPDLSSPFQFRMHAGAARHLAGDLEALHQVLSDAGARLGRDALRPIREVALAKDVWQSLAPQLDCRAIVVRTNYHPLSAVILADQAATGRLTITFQHCPVTAPASFVPLPSKRFVAFGATSAALLETLDVEFAEAAGQPRLCREIVPAGSLTDRIVPRTPRRQDRRILVIDSGDGFAPQFLGAGEQYAALENAVRLLAQQRPGGHTVTVRAHPRGGARRWQRLASKEGGSFDVSFGRPLADDLAAASVVIGLFSTVLPVAAAGGLPVLILGKPEWYFTPDLAPFVEHHFVTPEELSSRIESITESEEGYAESARSARLAASRYFERGSSCEFESEMIEALLAPL